MGGYAIAGYLPYMYSSVFDSYETIYAYLNAYVVAFGGFCSSIAGGWVTSKWVVTQPKANYYVPTLGCILGEWVRHTSARRAAKDAARTPVKAAHSSTQA